MGNYCLAQIEITDLLDAITLLGDPLSPDDALEPAKALFNYAADQGHTPSVQFANNYAHIPVTRKAYSILHAIAKLFPTIHPAIAHVVAVELLP